MLTDDELDQVAGGSNSEFEELQQLFGVVDTKTVTTSASVDNGFDYTVKVYKTKTVK